MRFWYVLHCGVSGSDDPAHMLRLTRALLLAYTNYKSRLRSRYNFRHLSHSVYDNVGV